MGNNKKNVLVLLVTLLITGVGFSMAFMLIVNNTDALLEIELETKDDKTLIFNKGNELELLVKPADFYSGAGDVTGETMPYVKLTTTTDDKEYYSVFINLYNNEIIYTSLNLLPEMVLNIYNEKGIEVTSVTGLTYYNQDGVSGFDITETKGIFEIEIDKEIAVDTASITHEWKFVVTFINLEELQNLNIGNSFNGQVCLAQSLGECDFKYLINDVILLNAGGIEYIEAKGEPDFSVIAETDEGMYAAEDDYGTTYYYRGAVENNWVEFGGFYWRIIRIDGNDSIKLIYSGSKSTGPVATGVDTQISTSTFKATNTSFADVGYVYQAGMLHGLTTNSTPKNAVDNWYTNNLLVYDEYIETSKFCIDRVAYIDEFGNVEITSENVTYYFNGHVRLITNKNPILNCSHSLDMLSLKVGMISADEISMAGGLLVTNNNSYYLYTENGYWTLTPAVYYQGVSSLVFCLSAYGTICRVVASTELGIRPVISLKSSLVSTGAGTVDNPYIILTD